MPRLDLNLGRINGLRQDVAALAAQQSRLDQQLLQQAAHIDVLKRQNTAVAAVANAEADLAKLRQSRAELAKRRAELDLRLDAGVNDLVLQRDPALLAEALDGGQPIALFPVRLETRYVQGGNALRIRIYPDVLNVLGHTAAVTDAEREGGTALWTARFAGASDEAERAERDLARAFGRSRAAWVVRVMQPLNLAELGQPEAQPQFPDIPAIDARAKATRAVLLPDRWCAIGYAAGAGDGLTEVFRVWGNRNPRRIADVARLAESGRAARRSVRWRTPLARRFRCRRAEGHGHRGYATNW